MTKSRDPSKVDIPANNAVTRSLASGNSGAVTAFGVTSLSTEIGFVHLFAHFSEDANALSDMDVEIRVK